MKKALIAVVVLGAVIASFGFLKMAESVHPTQEALFSSAVNLEKGHATTAQFVPDESGAYEGPCTAVCQGGKTGRLLFSSIR